MKLKDDCNFVKAAEFMRRALVVRRKVLGDDHPATKSTMDNLEAIEQQLKEQG